MLIGSISIFSLLVWIISDEDKDVRARRIHGPIKMTIWADNKNETSHIRLLSRDTEPEVQQS
jgi:hypothetical protein